MAREGQPELVQIRASAGSGKTYALAMNYMARLSQARGDCAPGQLAARAAEILAVTFTNAAAEEMRQRVIANLKKAALGILAAPGEQAPFSREMARKWLEALLDDLSALNIRTIDSLLHQIIRACALDLGLNPEYETVFDTAEALAPHVDRLLEESRNDSALRQMLSAACEAIINSGKESGFSRGKHVRDELDNVLGEVLAEKFRELTPLNELEAALRRRKDEAQAIARRMLDLMGDAAKNKVNKPALAILDAIALGDDETENAVWAKNPACFKKGDVQALYNSGGVPPRGLRELYGRLRDIFYSLGECDAIVREAARYYPLIAVGEAVARSFMADTERDATLPQARAALLASSVLKPLGEVSTALCRMGDRLRHYLVDEFQDTSQEQWNVLQALVLEAVSQGGSMIWVGDPKQSIYGWRGGNPELFDKVAEDRQLRRVAAAREVVLEKNWRSAPAIVEFNNKFFAPLREPAGAASILQSMLSGETEPLLLSAAAERVARAFADIEQEPAAEGQAPGYARLECLEASCASELRQASLERLRTLLLEEIRPRVPLSDVLILTRNNEFAREVAECLAMADIPAITDNGLALHENLLVRQLVSFLQFLDNPHNDVALWALLSGEIFAGHEDAGEFSLEHFTDLAAARGKKTLLSVFMEAYPQIWDSLLKPFCHQAALLTPYDLLMEWLKRARAEARFPEDRTMLRRFMETAHRAGSSGYGSISEFLIYWKEKGAEEKAPMPENMNAVRIMTIHRAKGLEQRVTIVPDTSFPIIGSGGIQVFSHRELGRVAARVRKEIREPYQEGMCRQAQEALNLLYVAFTRPVEELYVFYTRNTGKFKGTTASRAVGVLLEHAQWQCPVEIGRKPALPAELIQGQETAPQVTPQAPREDMDAGWRPMSWLPRLKIFHTPVRGGKMTGREAGILVHAALANWRPGGGLAESVAAALSVAQAETGLNPSAGLLSRINGWLAWLLREERVRSWLAHAMTEQPMLDADGRYMRADLLVPLASGCLVVDFKTGNPREKDIMQVQAYMRCVTESGQFPGEARGLLVYLAWQRFQCVTPDGGGALTAQLPDGLGQNES